MIDSLRISSIYAEKESEQVIKIDASTNNAGLLLVDVNGNDLTSKMQGRQLITNIKSRGLGNILIYDDTQYCILSKTTTNNFTLFKSSNLEYKINVNKTNYVLGFTEDVDNYYFELNLLEDIFKVYINGKDIKTYTLTTGILKVPKTEIQCLDYYDDNTITVIHYGSQVISGVAYIYYSGFNNNSIETLLFFDELDNIAYSEGYYGEGYYGETTQDIFKLDNFEGDLTLNTTETQIKYKDLLQLESSSYTTDRDSYIEFTLYDSKDKDDFILWLNNSRFRIIISNPYNSILRILTNCVINERTINTLGNKNTRKIKIEFSQDIYIKNSEEVV